MLIAQEWDGGVKSVSLEAGADRTVYIHGNRPQRTFSRSIKAAFLPSGFPHSVTPDYLGFQLWDTIQALSSYIRGMLSSQAILTGVGVGQEAATPLGAVFQFFMRDLAGMLGGILFATAQGSQLDSFAKQWRIFADCLNNVGMAIELASPLAPSVFLFLACMGSIARAVTGVAGGATRAALTQHFARQRNAADIAAKEGSQETATTMAGMILGMILIKATAGWQVAAWAAFLLLTWLHVYANIKALRCLHMTSLNRPRLHIVLAHFWHEGGVLAPADVAGRESLLAPPLRSLAAWFGLLPRNPCISVAPPLASLDAGTQQQLGGFLQAVLHKHRDSPKHLVLVSSKGSGNSGGSTGHARAGEGDGAHRSSAQGVNVSLAGGLATKAVVLLRLGSTAHDVLLAYCSAWLLLALPERWPEGDCRTRGQGQEAAVGAAAGRALTLEGAAGEGSRQGEHGRVAGRLEDGCVWSVKELQPQDMKRLQEFVGRLERAGWACDRVSLLQGECRLAWGRDLKGE